MRSNPDTVEEHCRADVAEGGLWLTGDRNGSLRAQTTRNQILPSTQVSLKLDSLPESLGLPNTLGTPEPRTHPSLPQFVAFRT